MLKPVTKEEKLGYTLQVQANKAAEELLADLYYLEEYDGYVDIWCNISNDAKNRTLNTEVRSKKVPLLSSPISNADALRFQLTQNKGIRQVQLT